VQAAWTLGGRPGRQRLSLGVDGTPSIATVVVADADPVPENTRITALEELPAAAPVNETLPEPVGIRVVDSAGAPVADVPVGWETLGGSLAADASRTDSLGEARARWTLGPRSGTQQASVQLGAVARRPEVRAPGDRAPGSGRLAGRAAERAAARIGGPGARLAGCAAGDRPGRQSGSGCPRRRAALERIGEPARAGDRLDGTRHDSLDARFHRGRAAAQRLGRGRRADAEITADARPGRADRATLEGLPASAPAGRALAQPVTLVVADAFGNAVPGAQVVFTTRSGKLTPGRVRTDSAGRAAAHWLLGTAAGDQQLEAMVQESGKRVTGKVRAVTTGKRKRVT
jgi:Bacterial Ig-like domain (group 1).